MAASDPQRLHDYLYARIQHFTVMGVTTFFETAGVGADAPPVSANGGRISYLSDNIVILSMEVKEKVKRTVSVIKARGGAHDLARLRGLERGMGCKWLQIKPRD
jgi:hypothetical protein